MSDRPDPSTEHLPGVARRFLRYVQIDTQSDPDSERVPSTEKQLDLCRLLERELRDLGASDVEMDSFGYVYGTVPSTLPPERAAHTPVLGLIAHVDTSPDASGTNVKPIVHRAYRGGVVVLPGDPEVRLDPARDPALLDHVGHDLITSDGTTLLGSDDKAGVAVIMQYVEEALRDAGVPRPKVRVCFTVDEEIGRGVDHLDLERLGAQVAYTLDGSGTGTLSAETFNAASAYVEVRGVAVHPGYAFGVMTNAVRILAELIASLPPEEAPETTTGRQGYFHPHSTREGDAERARVHILLRDFTAEGLEARKDFLREQVDRLGRKYPNATIRLDVRDSYRNMRSYIEEVDPRVVSFARAAAESMGMDLRMEVIRGGTDGARLSELGLPTPNVFTGGHQFHSRFEWNSVQNLTLSLDFLHRLVAYWGENGANKE